MKGILVEGISKKTLCQVCANLIGTSWHLVACQQEPQVNVYRLSTSPHCWHVLLSRLRTTALIFGQSFGYIKNAKKNLK